MLNRAKEYYEKNKEVLKEKQEINIENYQSKKRINKENMEEINIIICLKKINKS